MFQELDRSVHRILALGCYVGAVRIPAPYLLPDWQFLLPAGLLMGMLAWFYGRRRSPFLKYHGAQGVRWTLQANLLLAGVALLAKLLYTGWFYSGLGGFNLLWHFSATLFQWTGILVSLLSAAMMIKAAQGRCADALSA